MKFLGIDAEIVGNNETIYYILTHLTKLQRKLNIFLPPNYKDKFYFIIGLTHQCINIKYENVVPLSKNKFTNLNVNITGLEDLPDECIYNIFSNSYQEIFSTNNSIESIKKSIESEYPQHTGKSNLESIDSYGFYLFDEDDNELPSSYNNDNDNDNDNDSDSDSELVYESNEYVEGVSGAAGAAAGAGGGATAGATAGATDGSDEEVHIEVEIVTNDNESDDVHNIKLNKGIINCALKTDKFIKISLFLKEQSIDITSNEVIYDDTKLKYIESFLLNESIRTHHLFNLNNNIIEKKDAFNEHLTSYIESKFKMNKDSVLSYFYNNYIQKDDPEFIETLVFNTHGYHFNYNDIGFIISLNHKINSNISNNNSITQLSYKQFDKTRFNKIYKHDLKPSKKIDKMFNLIKTTLECDLCFKKIPTRNVFYSSCNGGDLCKSCYTLKKELFKQRLVYLKKLILLCGKRELFNQQKQLTINLLKNIKIPKLSKSKKQTLIESMLKQVHQSQHKYICKVCFGELEFKIDETEHIKRNEIFELNNGNTNISIACLCGHTFHTSCINHLTNIQCPFCRTNTRFTRLFL
jgi:hypothetical protein